MAALQTIPQNYERTDLNYQGYEKPTIDRILECAIILNWKDLTNSSGAISIQVEYHTKTNRSLEFLRLWSSTSRGFWSLVCVYRKDSSSTQASGTIFNTGHYSADLAWMLDAIMRHQVAFVLSSSEFLDGLVQVGRLS